MAQRNYLLSLFALFFIFVSGCKSGDLDLNSSPLTGDPSQDNCGFDIAEEPDTPLVDICSAGEGTEELLPSETYTREKGEPEEVARSFSVPKDGWIGLVVNNDGVASAEHFVDGELLVGTDRYNPHVSSICEFRQITAGEHVLTTVVHSKPGSSITLSVLFSPLDPMPRGQVWGTKEKVTIYNLRDNPDPFTPEITPGEQDETTFSAKVAIRRTDSLNPGHFHGFSFFLLYSFQVAGPDTCQQLKSFDGVVPIDPGSLGTGHGGSSLISTDISAVWDGKDEQGNIVPDGEYFYRVVVQAWRRHESNGMLHQIDAVASEIQTVQVVSDDTPPLLHILSPAGTNKSTHNTVSEVKGWIYDESGVLGVEVVCDDMIFEAETNDEGVFHVDVPLDPPLQNNLFKDKACTVTGTDIYNNKTDVDIEFSVVRDHIPRELLVSVFRSTPREMVSSLANSVGARLGYYIQEANEYQFLFPQGVSEDDAMGDLLLSDLVKDVSYNYIFVADTNDPLYNPDHSTLNQESLTIINANDVWSFEKGDKTLTIAVIDSGVSYLHEDLYMNIFINQGELPIDDIDEWDTDGDEVITFYDLNHIVNSGKIEDRNGNNVIDGGDIVDGDKDTDVGFEGDLNSDGCPGKCGVDDDLDGAHDLFDEDVMLADYNHNGNPLVGNNGVLESHYVEGLGWIAGGDDDITDVEVYSEKDDDENGHADDLIGYDIGCDPDQPPRDTPDPRDRCNYAYDNDPMDYHSHGTLVAGIIGAMTDNNLGVAGINWNVRILPVRVAIQNKDSFLNLDRAYSYVLDLARNQYNNIRVVNLSAGQGPMTYVPGKHSVIEQLDTAGILFVTSAGNDGKNIETNPYLPASNTNENIITVAAVDDDDELDNLGCNSNYGQRSVDIAAPGGFDLLDPVVLSTGKGVMHWLDYGIIPGVQSCHSQVFCYSEFYGTSAAAPHVSGVAGLLFAYKPGLTHAQVKSAIENGARQSSEVWRKVKTNGVLDALEATNEADGMYVIPKFGRFDDNSPVMSGDGRFIAFVSTRVTADNNPQGKAKIWIVGTDGSNLEQLTVGPDFPIEMDCFHPSINHDGSKVAFVCLEGADTEIFVADLDVNGDYVGVTKITDNTASDFEPSISADGNWVVYASDDPIDPSGVDIDVFIVSSDGQRGPVYISFYADHIWDNPDDRYPKISQDGTRVAMIKEDPRKSPYILAVELDLGDPIHVKNNYDLFYPKTGVLTGMDLSRDGSKVFVSLNNYNDEEACGIFSVDFDGSNLEQTIPCDYAPIDSIINLCGHYVSSANQSGSVIPFLRCVRRLNVYGIGILQSPNTEYDIIFSRADAEPTFFACNSAPNGYNPPTVNHEICSYSMSADGSKIVFTGAKVVERVPIDEGDGTNGLEQWKTDQDIYIINSDGTGLERLTAR